MNINIKSIPHNEQRYETIGDWQFTPGNYTDKNGNVFENTILGGTLNITISDLVIWETVPLIAVHELIEAILCIKRGISQESVDKFDKEFEANRQEGNTDEPGDDPKAPYRKEHFFATSIERLLCAELDIDWKEYEEKINSL